MDDTPQAASASNLQTPHESSDHGAGSLPPTPAPSFARMTPQRLHAQLDLMIERTCALARLRMAVGWANDVWNLVNTSEEHKEAALMFMLHDLYKQECEVIR